MFKFSEDIRESYPDLMDREFSYKQLGEAYRDVVDKNQYSSFEDWFYDMRRNSLISMGCPSESEMKEYALECAKEITLRTYDERGNSSDLKRKATPGESEKLYWMIYTGMCAMRFYSHDAEKDGHQIIGTVEYGIDIMLPDVNGFDSVYLPVFQYWHGYKREEIA